MHKTFTHTQRRTWMHCHSLFPSLFLSVICTHTHTVCCVCRKLELMTDFVLCVCSLSCPLDTLYPPSRKQPFVFLSLSLSPSISISLSILFSLSPYFLLSLENGVVLLCSAVYITYCIYFLGAWQQIYEHSSGCFFFGWHQPFTFPSKWCNKDCT